jgi:hypothetical protein
VIRRRADGTAVNIKTREEVPARPPATITAPPPCPKRLAAKLRQARAQVDAILHLRSGGSVSGGSASSRRGKLRIGC